MKKILLSIIMFVIMHFAFSQTAVYFCTTTGAVGYCVGTQYVNTCAYSKCINAGGYNPVNVILTPLKGYGAIAIGYNNGRRIIGASAGFSTRYEAEQAARSACYNNGGYSVYIHETWADF